TLTGVARAVARARAGAGIEVKLGALSGQTLPPLGLGVPAEEIEPTLQRAGLLKLAAPRTLQCHIDPRCQHGSAQLSGYRKLAEHAGASVVLEVVVESLDRYAAELQHLAAQVRQAGLALEGVAVCPVGDLKSVLPGGERPPAPPLEDLYAAARRAFPGVKLGGGMFSFFTELNRKRPPTRELDFVMNTTCPIVHAADDRSVMETLEALPFQVSTARTYFGQRGYRVGPSAIGCRDNPHGATFTPNPDNLRVCLAKMDPRVRGLFGAAWTLGYIATLARTGIDALTIGAPTGPLGIIYRKADYAQPYYDDLAAPAVYPVFHVISGLTRGAGAKVVDATCSDDQRVQCLAYRAKGGGTTLWLANLTAERQSVRVAAGQGAALGAMVGALLDEHTFDVATAHPVRFQNSLEPMADRVTLEPYAVAIVAVSDR
ncbi:MAG TPA: hypothetical protein VLJ62_08250, partial [Burkholderiaceae bacterium]|nr:hypothetical protein [Burkholderiaceae bacterium]